MPIFYPDILENNNSDYPLVDATFLKGNAYPLAELTDTGSIPTNKRRVGLIVFTSGSQEWYGYKGQDVSGWDTPSNWEQIGAGGGGSTDYISNVAYDTGSISFTGVGSAFDGVISINDLTSSLVSSNQTSSFVTNDETGSFYYSSSVNLNTVTFYQGDGTTENVTVDTGSSATIDTGSFYYSSSVELNTITFYQGDGTTESTTVDTGSVTDISALNLHTGSINTFTGSIQTEVDNLTAATSSYLTGEDTGSFLYSGSYDSNTSNIRLYSQDQNYDLDLSGLAGGSGGLPITASYTGSVLTQNVRSFDFEGNGVKATNVGSAVTVTVTQVDTGSFVTNDQTSSFVTNDETGSFYISSSVNLNTITFTQGDGTTESVTVDTGSSGGSTDYIHDIAYSTGSIQFHGSGSAFEGSININELTASLVDNSQTSSFVTNTDTGSFYISSSINSNTITFTQGDGTTESVTVPSSSIDYIHDIAYSTGSIQFHGSGSAFEGAININELTASLVDNSQTSSFVTNTDTGSFYISSSVNLNTITFTQGDGTTETVTVDTGSAVATDTGSFYISSSVNLNTITFTQGDGTTESVIVDTGSITAPGNDTEVIYNKDGDFHATASFTFNDDSVNGQELIIDGTKVNENASLKVSGSESSYFSIGESLIYNNVSLNFSSINHTFLSSGNTLSWETDDDNEGPQWVLGDRQPNQNQTTGSNFTIVPGYTNDRDALFRIYRTPSLNNWVEAFSVSSSGQVYMPELGNTTTPHIVGYDSTTGELTYYSTGSFGSGGGSIDTGSFYISSSLSNNTITFTQGDGTTESVTVTGSNIYNTNGTLIADRTLNGGSNSLTSNNLTNFSVTNATSSIEGPFYLLSQVPNATKSDILYLDTSTGEVSYGASPASIDTGSFYISSSVSLNTITFTQGDGTTEIVTVHTGSDVSLANTDQIITGDRLIDLDNNALTFDGSQGGTFLISSSVYSEVQISGLPNTAQPNVVAYDTSTGTLSYVSTGSFGSGGGSIDTGSFYISSSVNLNTITFTQGDGTTESVTVDTGSSASSTDTGSFYVSSSINAAGNTITFNQGDGTTESVTVTPDYTIQKAVDYLPNNTSAGATNLELIVGSIRINGASSVTTVTIGQLAGRTAGTDAHITATLYASNNTSHAVSVGGISSGGAITFNTSANIDEESTIMYHIFIT